MKNLFYLVLF